MAETKKRQRDEDEAIDITDPLEAANGSTPKRARKETNASARRSLFVRSLPAIATTEKLTELFSQNYPLKHATVVTDPVTKQSKGYGFVTFADAEDAQRALEEFNGQSFQGRKMRIEIAQPRSREVTATGGAKVSTVSAKAAAEKKARQEQLIESRKPPKLIIRNLPWSIKEPEQLADLFRKFGKIKHSVVPKIKNTQAGFGFVVLRGRKNAEKALAEMNGVMVDGRPIAVDWAVDKDAWENQKNAPGKAEDSDGTSEDGNQDAHDDANLNQEDADLANFMRNHMDNLEDEDEEDSQDEDEDMDDEEQSDEENDDDFETETEDEDMEEEGEKKKSERITDNSSTLFIRNLPFTTLDADLKEHFMQFGPVRYARVVMDKTTDRPRGTGFVCFFNVEDADSCFRGAPRHQPTGANAIKRGDATNSQVKHSVLEDESADPSGMYTIEGRVLQVSRAVARDEATKLTEEGASNRTNRDKDKRKLYLLSEGTVAAGTPLYDMLAPSEIKMREDSAKQRKKLIQNNPTLHLSLTRLSIRNIPRNLGSKDLKALAREAVVGFAKDVKSGLRAPLSKEEESRGGEEMKNAEKQRKAKGKGVVKQAKIVFEGSEGSKISEESGAGRSRGYGFVEYSSHRWALMGLRWLNGHGLKNSAGRTQHLIVEFAIENAQVVSRRKEREEKARQRSKEVLEARARGEMATKGKKVLSRDTAMSMTRKGMKGKKGEPAPGEGKSFEKIVYNAGAKLEASKNKGSAKKATRKVDTEDSKQEDSSRDPRLAKKQQIIARKRMLRRNRKKGAA
ncbi:hypothetical protein F5884DRAFT_104076 [Xylogone sp. PMI_703]|nr:hypothetical protein F5884DRAFT_104076 [Xylogone sp. PMI_703]